MTISRGQAGRRPARRPGHPGRHRDHRRHIRAHPGEHDRRTGDHHRLRDAAGTVGQPLPIISKIGGGALLCLMVPAVLVYFNMFNETMLNATTALMKEANFLYFVISMLVLHQATLGR
jgi:hypothetical protein